MAYGCPPGWWTVTGEPGLGVEMVECVGEEGLLPVEAGGLEGERVLVSPVQSGGVLVYGEASGAARGGDVHHPGGQGGQWRDV